MFMSSLSGNDPMINISALWGFTCNPPPSPLKLDIFDAWVLKIKKENKPINYKRYFSFRKWLKTEVYPSRRKFVMALEICKAVESDKLLSEAEHPVSPVQQQSDSSAKVIRARSQRTSYLTKLREQLKSSTASSRWLLWGIEQVPGTRVTNIIAEKKKKKNNLQTSGIR